MTSKYRGAEPARQKTLAYTWMSITIAVRIMCFHHVGQARRSASAMLSHKGPRTKMRLAATL